VAALKTQNLRDLDWTNVAALVLAPGVPLTHPTPHWPVSLAHKANVEVIGDIELFCRERAKSGRDCPLIAITGTNGKSTTTALTTHLLNQAGRDAQMGGNIGVPVLALGPFNPGRAYVLEVSSYQIDLAPSLKPTICILLNVSEDHIDRHGTMANYAAIKERLPASVERGGTAVIDIDDGFTLAAADQIQRAGKTVERVSVEGPLADGYFAEGSRISEIYGGATRISERHRHRYEVNVNYKDRLEAVGLRFAGMSPDGELPETVEIPEHPYFLGCQFHPEFKSKPLEPHPLFSAFIQASYANGTRRRERKVQEEVELFRRRERVGKL